MKPIFDRTVSPANIIGDLLSTYCNLPPSLVKNIPARSFDSLSDIKLKNLRLKLEITLQALCNEQIKRLNEQARVKDLNYPSPKTSRQYTSPNTWINFMPKL